jgi:hypothetical protein
VLLLLAVLVAQPTSPAFAQGLTVCHGYSCYYQTSLRVGSGDLSRISAMMREGSSSAEAERQAISNVIQLFEQRATATIGVRDRPKGELGRGREIGQMDCVDESTNTTRILQLIASQGLMRHHKVLRRTSRGFLLDNRFPHFAAVVADTFGNKWAIDSWYEPGGGKPDIMPLDRWLVRGVAGKR